MSDEEEQYVSEDETQSDFSASEDEWRATDDDTESSDSDFQDDIVCSDDEVIDKPKHRTTTSSLSTRGVVALSDATQPRTKKCLSQSVRNKSYNKYRPQLSFNNVIQCTTQNVSAHSRVSITLKTSKYIRKLPAESLRRGVRVTISRSTRKIICRRENLTKQV